MNSCSFVTNCIVTIQLVVIEPQLSLDNWTQQTVVFRFSFHYCEECKIPPRSRRLVIKLWAENSMLQLPSDITRVNSHLASLFVFISQIWLAHCHTLDDTHHSFQWKIRHVSTYTCSIERETWLIYVLFIATTEVKLMRMTEVVHEIVTDCTLSSALRLSIVRIDKEKSYVVRQLFFNKTEKWLVARFLITVFRISIFIKLLSTK